MLPSSLTENTILKVELSVGKSFFFFFYLKTFEQILVVSTVDKMDCHLKYGHIQINAYDLKINYSGANISSYTSHLHLNQKLILSS